MPETPATIINDIELEIVNLTMTTLVRILDFPREVRSDTLALYVFYCKTAKRQHTIKIKATDTYCMEGLGWTNTRFYKTKKLLLSEKLIEPVTRKDETGRVVGHYIHVRYVSNKNHSLDYQRVVLPESGNLETNALDKKENALDKKPAPHKSLGWLEAIPEEDLKTLSTDFSFSYKETQEEARRAADWLRAKGRTYKDYRAFFRNWLRNAVRFRSEQKSVSNPRQISHDGFAI